MIAARARAQVAAFLRALIAHMEATREIRESHDLMPELLDEAVADGIISADIAQPMRAVAETAGWFMLKMCKVGDGDADWKIFKCDQTFPLTSLNQNLERACFSDTPPHDLTTATPS